MNFALDPEFLVVDLLRVFLVILPGSLVFMATAAVLRAYIKAFRMDMKVRRVTGHRHMPYGLLPRHVMGVSVATMIYSIITVFDTIGRLDTNLTWRFYLYVAANPIMVYSLWCVLRFERLRYQHAED